jgi:predicted nucleotidyltransferase
MGDIGTIFRKGRTRPNRGKLKSFNDLPLDAQTAFTKIKNELNSLLGDDRNIYVHGSFYWGFWDDESDYDVTVDWVDFDIREIQNKLIEKFDTEINVGYDVHNDENIIIP